MSRKRFQRAKILEQLTQADLHPELAREHQGRLRKDEGIESQFEDARVHGRGGQVRTRQIAQKLAKFGEHGVIVTGRLVNRFRW
jgi:hypothetical protein